MLVKISHLLCQLLCPHRVALSRDRPVICAIPPSTNARTQAAPTDLCCPIPVSPAEREETQYRALEERKEDLVFDGDANNFPRRIGILDAGEVGLLEAHVGDGRKVVLDMATTLKRPDHVDRNLIVLV